MSDTSTEGAESSGTIDPLVGRRLASYEVLARVARGGMGVVYRARHVYIDKIVALKVLDPALAEREDLIERFRTEAQSLARVEHDNVVKVIDILEDAGVHFIVMDFAEGTNLRNHVRKNGPMGGDDLLSVARQTAEALYAAHRQGILHRDIKPENLIMNARGRCKLADFGLAGDMRLISEGHEGPLNFGTPAYSAPEVLRRMVPDKRSDIFSYGATLFFLATGEPPFGQSDARSVMLRQKQGAELLEARRPDLPEKLCALIMDCIALHPKDRPDGFREVMDRLPRRFIPRPPERTATAPTEPHEFDSGTHETPRRSGIPGIVVAAVAAGVAAVALILGLWLWPNGAPDKDNASPRPNATTGEVSPSADAAPPADDSADDPGSGPAFGPEDEAFSNAQLVSGDALSNADYRAAFDAWATFLRLHPASSYADEARKRQNDVAARVEELREKAYGRALEAAGQALKEKRTNEAMAALDRFPEELLVPLSDSDEVSVADRLDTQRRVIEATDATDLVSVMQQADKLRIEWNKSRGDSAPDEFRRMRSAGNLLGERELLEGFITGRLAQTQVKVERRLKAVRKLLESAHQEAMAPVEAWRRFHDHTLGEWAATALSAIDEQESLLARRQHARAVERIEELLHELARARDAQAEVAENPRVAERIRSSEFVIGLVSEFAADLRLARDTLVSVESALRLERRANNVREYLVHDGRDGDGALNPRLDRHAGRVVSVTGDEFVVLTDNGRKTLKFELLTAGTVRKLIRAQGDFDDQLRLVAWLTAIGERTNAEVEFARLERMDDAPRDVLARGRAMIRSGRLAPGALRRLRYLALRAGVIDSNDLDDGSLEARLATAQAGVRNGNAVAAGTYAGLVNGLVHPEMVNLATFERALALIDASENDLRLRVLLEPLHPGAHAALAGKLAAQNEHAEAREAAGRALLLDPSNEQAFSLLRD